jgi:hypothetical protein
MNKQRRQKWLALIERKPGAALCNYCKHFKVEDFSTYEYREFELHCTSPLGNAYYEDVFMDDALEASDCWRFANKLPYKEAEGE